MQAEIEKGVLVIRVPVNKTLPPSKSGKTRIVATTGGNISLPVQVEGQNVILGLNAYIK